MPNHLPSLALAALLSAAPVAAQETATAADGSTPVPIGGRVVSAETGHAVAGAVLKRGSRIVARTDSTGTFQFCAARGERVGVEVAVSGFAPLHAVLPAGGRAAAPVRLPLTRDPSRVYISMYENWEASGPQPLTIVDGVRRDLGADSRRRCDDPHLFRLHVEDVATIDVVKAPEAVERFGPDAIHGVVLVTTRRARGVRP